MHDKPLTNNTAARRFPPHFLSYFVLQTGSRFERRASQPTDTPRYASGR